MEMSLSEYLKGFQDIKSETITILVKKYGFETKKSLLAINVEKDLEKMNAIKFYQQLVLRDIILKLKEECSNAIVKKEYEEQCDQRKGIIKIIHLLRCFSKHFIAL